MHCPSGVRTNLDIGEDEDANGTDSHNSVPLEVPPTREINLIPSGRPSKNDTGETSWLSSGKFVINVSLLGSVCGRTYRWVG